MIDVGSNSVRLVIAQDVGDGDIEVLERLHRPARLGQDTFVHGRLGQEAMNATAAILRDYRRMLDTYSVTEVRAVATSAVREASNADAFLDRMLMATNVDIEIIEPTEESRLTVGAVLDALAGHPDLTAGEALVADVGGGSALLTLMADGQIVQSASHRLGSIRMQEMLSTADEPAERAADLLRHQIATVVSTIRSSTALSEVRTFIAVGGDARFAAREVGRSLGGDQLHVVDADELDKLVGRCEIHPPEELSRRYALEFADAETLVPALLVYQALLHETGASEMIVSEVSMRDGLLLDLVRSGGDGQDEAMRESIIHSAESVAEKYRYDAAHARHVGDLAGAIFDEMQDEHHLSQRDRMLLRVAAVLHDVGAYVNSRAHHKHSYYLIVNSEVFGLQRRELQIVANVARYHRRSSPKQSHVDYISLAREHRMVVTKLAAILRVADALDRGHAQQIRDVSFEKTDDEFIIYVRDVPDLALERRALAVKADLFEEIYGRRVRLEEAHLRPSETRRADAVE